MDFNTYQETVHNLSDYKKEIGPFSMILAIIKDTGTISEKLRYILSTSFENTSSITLASILSSFKLDGISSLPSIF